MSYMLVPISLIPSLVCVQNTCVKELGRVSCREGAILVEVGQTVTKISFTFTILKGIYFPKWVPSCGSFPVMVELKPDLFSSFLLYTMGISSYHTNALQEFWNLNLNSILLVYNQKSLQNMERLSTSLTTCNVHILERFFWLILFW